MSIEQELEKLSNNYEKTKEQAIRINTEIDSASKKLAQLKEQALKEYGTDDIEKLASILDSWEKENKAEVDRFSQELNSLIKDVQNKDQQLKSLES